MAYKFHMKEAARFKEMLSDIAKSLTTDLDKPRTDYDDDLAEQMKKELEKKKDRLWIHKIH